MWRSASHVTKFFIGTWLCGRSRDGLFVIIRSLMCLREEKVISKILFLGIVEEL